ncbi:MAG: Abi family protein [Pseudonocardiaceae bacterium]
MTSPDSTYAKPFLTIPEQARRLRERGMDCGTDAFAFSVLERYGYYRLSGYWHLHRARPVPPHPQFDDDGREIRLDSFVDGTTLAHVVSLYDFDHELRTRLSDVLSAIETALRFFVGHRLGRADQFAHRKPETLDAVREVEPPILTRVWDAIMKRSSPIRFEPTKTYHEWLQEYDRHEKRARDVFVLHFREKYGPHLPIWVATEVMSFGVLSNLYTLMPQVDQEILAARFQIHTADGHGDRGALANWLNNLRNVRNICAHYGRVWNRTFDVQINAAGQTRKDADNHLSRLADDGVKNKLYGVLLILRHLLLSIGPDRTDVIDLADFISTESQRLQIRMHQLGFPDGWKSDPIWDPGFILDRAPMLAASLLDRAPSLSTTDTRAALVGAEVKASEVPRNPEQEQRAKSAAQRKLLKDYRRYNVIVEIVVGETKYYPTFQFRDGKIIDALAEVNKTLSEKCVDAHPVDVASALLDWWQTPHPDVPKDADGLSRSPLDLLNSVTEAEFTTAIAEADCTSSFVVPAPCPQDPVPE